MIAAQAVLRFVEVRAAWTADWVWGCPLIVVTVIFHVLGLEAIGARATAVHENLRKYGPKGAAAAVIGGATLLATLLHGIEASIWAWAYILIGSLPDVRSAMLYSLGALTTYGHQNVYLGDRWHLLGALEALNGWLLFGLTTAFLFGLMQEVSSRKHASS